ncbi:MAG: hydroxymethylglutaryl-CoA lyase [Candidatus Sericytochromatia bacterium]|nr:hydroxymethylglutaryl-CoA lyase [Candidatus Sericytochromatia bacterium]
MVLPKQVKIVEVGPRDGLQNETQILSADDKVRLIDQLSLSGFKAIEIGSFVRPDRIPPLADTEQVAQRIQRLPGINYSALVPNAKGLARAKVAGLQSVAIFMSATNAHNLKNTNRTTAQALAMYPELVQQALAEGMQVRAYLSTVFGCPYEGEVKPQQVLPLVQQLLAMGVYEVSLGDTIGVSNPLAVQRTLEYLLEHVAADKLALHFHDTRGTALANVLAGLQMGITTFDAAIGGLGGCPYAPGAAGNVSTEDLVYMLHGMDIATGIDLDRLVSINHYLSERFQRRLMSRYALTRPGLRI